VNLPALTSNRQTTIMGIVGAILYGWAHANHLDIKTVAICVAVSVFGYLTKDAT